MPEAPVITVDGPGGVGKGTVCAELAKKTGWHLLDSGAIYRVLAYASFIKEISLDDEAGLSRLASDLNVTFQQTRDGDQIGVFLDGEEISEAIRSEKYGSAASHLARHRLVRKGLLDRQRSFRKSPGLIADGRDMGTVVFPDAPVKIFLIASQKERSNRRYKQLKEQGFSVNLARLSTEIAERDKRDQARAESPLRPAPDAVTIDTTNLRIEQVIEAIWDVCKQNIPDIKELV